MDMEMRIKILENAYIGSLVDAIYNFTKQGVLNKVTEEKRKIQMITGKKRAEQFGITKPEDVFKRLSDIFNCAFWELEYCNDGFEANSKSCKLCTYAKKMGTEAPCNMYCLHPMEGMIKGIDPKLKFKVSETLWEGEKCKVKVSR
ncbi:L-2-amino-thiazoline-4-carboxylic acid hydrolase [Maledivibacter halophilus]|uniref:L-2-amino-thiazoline-4-carboxylic acid hydrolase n=1 Tax=Maledivibacter halophilus TaxID=36842 RepID=A0A1T5MML3_9FIRM|nr:L-2-amino-thiazoline-4-carboxylic acid hydrolase [Maledivibacter halophilus]SKC89452.1 L-2-amino-thiazoline-4-carboxylic acid hydrolase [Maledivibacter halophilus]